MGTRLLLRGGKSGDLIAIFISCTEKLQEMQGKHAASLTQNITSHPNAITNIATILGRSRSCIESVNIETSSQQKSFTIHPHSRYCRVPFQEESEYVIHLLP